MEVDIHSLETYNELARTGAESAAQALSEMTGMETRVDVTGVSLLSPSDLEYEFADREFAGVSVGLGEPLSGETVLAFDEGGRTAITETLVPVDDPERAQGAVVEVGNIMANGFISGWADHLDTTVKPSPPEYVEGTGLEVLPERAGDDGSVFVFKSRVEAISGDFEFRILLLPEIDSLEGLLEDRTDGGISVDKLEVFTEMTERGAAKAADNIQTMTGLEADVQVNRLNFTSLADIPGQVGDDRRVGTVVKYDGTPSGYLAILFDPDSAKASVDALMPMSLEGEGWSDTEQGALEELCNVMVSGFIDGWANVLQTSIKHSPPTFTADMGSSIVSPIIADVARTVNYAFLLDSSIETDDTEAVSCQLFALPHPKELESALEELLVDRAEETGADPSDVF